MVVAVAKAQLQWTLLSHQTCNNQQKKNKEKEMEKYERSSVGGGGEGGEERERQIFHFGFLFDLFFCFRFDGNIPNRVNGCLRAPKTS